MKPTRLLLILTTIVALSSCMDLRVDLAFSSAQSGTVSLNYRIDSRALEIGMFDPDATILPLPVGQRDFERTASAIPDLELKSYRMRQQNGTTVVDAEFSFVAIEALSTLFGATTPLTVESDGSRTLFRHQLFAGIPDGVGDTGTGMVESFFADSSFSMSLTAPAAIVSSNLGDVDGGGRTARIDYHATDIVNQREPIRWEIVW